MRITFLGTSSGTPTRFRNVSAIVVALDQVSNTLLFDCGEGTQHQFQKSNTTLAKLSSLFITHLHGDHCYGLPGLLCSMSMGATTIGNEQQSNEEENSGNSDVNTTKTIRLYGPLGLAKFLRSSLRVSGANLCYKLQINEIVPQDVSDTDLAEYDREKQETPLEYETDGEYIRYSEEDRCWNVCRIADQYSIKCASLSHSIFSLGYVIQEDPFPGMLDMNKCKEFGVPRGPLLGKLKNGEDVQLDDGSIVRSSDVVGPDQEGRKVVILGDTCGSENMQHIAHGCDFLTHESTLADEQMDMAIARGHSTPTMAAQFARSIAAKKLVLTHFSARFVPQDHAENETQTVEYLVKQAQQWHDNVEAANDLQTFTVPRRK